MVFRSNASLLLDKHIRVEPEKCALQISFSEEGRAAV